MRTLSLHRTVLTDIISETDRPGEDHQRLKQIKAECTKPSNMINEMDKRGKPSMTFDV